MTRANELEACLDDAFRRLTASVIDRRHPFHTPTLATTAPDGAPEARTVVLRGFDPSLRIILFHTDARSGKVASLLQEARCAFLFYHAEDRLQLRLAGRCTLHADDAIADEAWLTSRPAARKCYAHEVAPGSVVPSPPPAPDDPLVGRPHFRVLRVRFHWLDWLHLAAAGHRRALFTWCDRDESVSASWLVP